MKIHKRSEKLGRSVANDEDTALWFTHQKIHLANDDTSASDEGSDPNDAARSSPGEPDTVLRRRRTPQAALSTQESSSNSAPQLAVAGHSGTNSILEEEGLSSDSEEGESQSSPGRLSKARLAVAQWLREQNQAYLPLFGESVAPSSLVPGLRSPQKNMVDFEISLLTELGRAFSVRTHLLVFLLLIVNALVRPALLSIIPPLAVFTWGGLSRPFPSFRFWTTLYYYVAGALLLKYIFQFHFWGAFNAPPPPEDPCAQSYFRPNCMTFARFVGIYRSESGPAFLGGLVPDALALAALALHRLVLESLGIWR